MSLEGKATAHNTIKGNINKLYELRGYSAYEVALLNGFKGTEKEWLDSLTQETADKAEAIIKSEKEVALNEINAKGEKTLASIPEDYTELNNSVKKIADTYAVKDDLSYITSGHFKAIPYTFYTKGNYYQEINGVISVRGTKQSSGIIPAPKNLCLHFGDDGTSTCFLYFYKKSANGEYTVTFDFYNTNTSNLKNYISVAKLESRMIQNIPDDTYMEICSDSGMVELYGWDGEPFGMDVCANCSIPTSSGNELWFYDYGDAGITVHGKAKHIIANGAVFKLVYGYKNGAPKQLNGSIKRYFKLPEGYDYFRIRIEPTTEDGKSKTLTGNVRNFFHIVANETEEFPISNAIKVIDNCEKVCNLTWTPKKSIYVNNNTTIVFKPNVEYNGLLYGSQWDSAHYIGWHVSPHTFINAMNDDESIMYHEYADNGAGVLAPIYGTVCSAFATMCAGWECPQTNAGFFYDPDIEKHYTNKPPFGQVYTDIKDHCVIPCGITQIGKDSLVSAYESIRPVSAKTVRFMSISSTDIWKFWNASAGSDYYNTYGYAVHNPRAKADMSLVPYADFENATITNGSARPYKGDKSVYTSAEESVKINIKSTNASILYLKKDGALIGEITIDGASVVDVKNHLQTNGIYTVCTDVDSVEESFEYVNITPISYTIGKDGDSLTFSDNDFWYALCSFGGVLHYQNGYDANGKPKYQTRGVSVMADAGGNYAKWFATGNKINTVHTIFKKGTYGAYVVPVEVVVENDS